jgi:hypothetical protein
MTVNTRLAKLITVLFRRFRLCIGKGLVICVANVPLERACLTTLDDDWMCILVCGRG